MVAVEIAALLPHNYTMNTHPSTIGIGSFFNASEPIRVAVIGGGHLGKIHAKLLSQNPAFRLVAVAEPVESQRQWIQSNLNIPCVEDYRSLADQIDAVVIASPTVHHHSIAHWCIENMLHVFVEKPITATFQQAYELVQFADATRRTLQVGHVERFNAAWNAANEHDTIGSLQYVQCAREGTYTGRSTDVSIVMDLMIHDIDLLLSTVRSEVIRVDAHGWSALGSHADFAVANLLFQNGCFANLRASRISSTPRRCMQLHGECGTIEIDFASPSVTAVTARPDVQSKERLADVLPMDQRATVKDELFTHWLEQSPLPFEPVNAIQLEHEDFANSIRTGAAPRVDGHAGLKALDIALRIDEAILARMSEVPDIIHAAERFGRRRQAS